MPRLPTTPAFWSRALLAGVILGVSLLSGAVAAADAQAQAKAVFSKVLKALNSSSPSGISSCIDDGKKATFTFKSTKGGLLTEAKATTQLKKWFDGGAKGGGWKQMKSQTTGQPWVIFERKSDGRKVTVNLKWGTKSYCLHSLTES